MEVVPGELSGHVDDLTVLTPPSLLYQGLPRESSDEGRGESISRPSGLALILRHLLPPSSTRTMDASHHKLRYMQSFVLLSCLQSHVSARPTPNFLSYLLLSIFYFCLETDILGSFHLVICHLITCTFRVSPF